MKLLFKALIIAETLSITVCAYGNLLFFISGEKFPLKIYIVVMFATFICCVVCNVFVYFLPKILKHLDEH